MSTLKRPTAPRSTHGKLFPGTVVAAAFITAMIIVSGAVPAGMPSSIQPQTAQHRNATPPVGEPAKPAQRLSQTAPLAHGDVIFSQMPYRYNESWQAYSSKWPLICYEDFSGLNTFPGGVQFWGIYHGNVAGLIFAITFYEDNGGMPGREVASFTNLTPVAVPYEAWGDWGSEYEWTADFGSVVLLDAGWVSVLQTGGGGNSFHWVTSPTGNCNARQNDRLLGVNLAFNLTEASFPDHDVKILNIIQPTNDSILRIIQSTNETVPIIAPRIKVANVGNDTETFSLNLNIMTSTLEYNHTQNITLVSRHITEIVFPDWTPAAWHTIENTTVNYTAVATAFLATDQNQTDNIKTKPFTLTLPAFHDLHPAVLSPFQDTLARPIPVKLQIQNVGQYPESNFSVRCQFGHGRFINEDFSHGVPPTGWGANAQNWQVGWSNYAGGTLPEACLSSQPLANGTLRLWTNALNTTGQTHLLLTFRQLVDDDNGVYDLAVQTTTDGGATWNTVWTIPGGPRPAHSVAIDLDTTDGVGSATFQLAWVFIGNTDVINAWYIDDVRTYEIEPYNETVSVPTSIDPGASVNVSFPNWTPANVNTEKISGTLEYMTIGTQLLETDTNPTNDVATATFQLYYCHDVCVRITPPNNLGENRDCYLHYDDGTNQGVLGTYGTFEAAIRLTPAEQFIVMGGGLKSVHLYYGGFDYMDPSAALKIYTGGNATGPGPILYTQPFTLPSSPGWFDVELDHWISLPGTKDVWVSVECTNMYLGVDDGPRIPGKGDWVYMNGNWTELINYGCDVNWNIWVYVLYWWWDYPTTFYVGPGPQNISGVVSNRGTFGETNLTCTAVILGTDGNHSVYQDTIYNITLNPLGGHQNICFANYTFTEEGTYTLSMNVTLDTDDYPFNNQMNLTYIADLTPPVSSINLPPPDGNDGWYREPHTISFTAYDNVTYVRAIMYSIDGENYSQYDGPILMTTERNHTICWYAIDSVGNDETPHSILYKVDPVPPVVYLEKTIHLTSITYTADVSDNRSGVEHVEFWLEDVLQTSIVAPGPYVYTLSPVPHANLTVTAIAYDNAGNCASAQQRSVSQDLPGGQCQQAPRQTLRRALNYH